MDTILEFFHSLLRWGVLFALVVAIVVSWKGYFAKSPIIVWHRAVAIVAMVLCHVQLVIGAVLYGMRFARKIASQPALKPFIAEEVQQVLPELVALDEKGEPASVKYHVLPALLLAEVQRLQVALANASSRTAALESAVAELRSLLVAARQR